jgi:Lon protease-like protein
MATSLQSHQLGLFPLPDVVLFPGMLLPLHVFEPRYRRLLHDVLASDGMLAIPRLKPGFESEYYRAPAVHDICGIGRVVQHEQLADGRYNILVRGTARGRLLTETAQEPYRTAHFEVLTPPKPAADITPGMLHRELIKLLQLLVQSSPSSNDELVAAAREIEDLGECVDALSSLVETADERQTLLETLDPAARAILLLAHLQELLTQLSDPTSSRPLAPN